MGMKKVLKVIVEGVLLVIITAPTHSQNLTVSDSTSTISRKTINTGPGNQVGKKPALCLQKLFIRDVDLPARGFTAKSTINMVQTLINTGSLDITKSVGKKSKRMLESPIITVTPYKTLVDKMGNTHIRMSQQYQGLRVIGAEIIVHKDRYGSIFQINGKYLSSPNIPITPSINSDTALQVGLDELWGRPQMRVSIDPELVIYAGRLAYFYIIEHKGPDVGQWHYYVDAQSGELLFCYNNIQYAPPTPGNGSHQNISGNRLAGEDDTVVTMEGWLDTPTSNYFMYNFDNLWGVYDLDAGDWEQQASSSWGTADRTAVSAGYNFETVQDFVSNIMGLNSFDNAGAFARANVHEGTNYVNAYWDGMAFYFGDGDGAQADPLTTLDIVAHEYGHALTDYSSDLIYSYESGALNEAYSDIMGAAVEFWAQPDGRAAYPSSNPGESDWLMGEDCWLVSEALRNLRDPQSYGYPSYYQGTNWYFGSSDNGGVHTNCTVLTFAFYLLADGGTGTNDGTPYDITGLGIEQASEIAISANLYYHVPTDEYGDARQAWINSATDLGYDVSTVGAVFDAIGVLDSCSPIDDLINDGSFENGPPPASAWTEWSSSGAEWIIDPTGVWGIPAYHCDNAFWAGGYFDGSPNSDYVEQTIDIPANAQTLNFQTCLYRPDADDPSPDDVFSVSINGTPIFSRDITQVNDTYPDWELQILDISAYAGQTVTIRFEAVSTGTQTGNVLVDAISIGTGWNQSVSSVNTSVYANQDFIDPVNDIYDIFIADDFVCVQNWGIQAIFVPGNVWNTGTTLMNATALHFEIYADGGGVPDGDPRGGGNPPIWSLSVPPTDTRITIDAGIGGFPSNVTLNLDTWISLLPGTYWLVFYPEMEFAVGGQYGRHVSDTTNGYHAQVINPDGGFGFPTTWTSVTDPSVWNLSQQDFAFRIDVILFADIEVAPTSLSIDSIEGDVQILDLDIANVGDTDLVVSDISDDAAWLSQSPTNGTVSPGDSLSVNITFDATGMSPGIYDAVIEIQSNDPDEAIIDIPITMNVISPGTIQFSSATVSVGENDGTAIITLTRAGGSNGTVSIDCVTSDGTASSGSDYVSKSETLSWSDGDSSAKIFSVSIIDDTNVEGGETIILTLSNPQGGASLGTQNTATITISNDDLGNDDDGGDGGGSGGGGGGGCFITTLNNN